MYKPGGTIAQALAKVQKSVYVLPAIQREFVWKPEQIEKLFDSLMQGYPFGTFLLWKVDPKISGKFKFYDFVLNYHERDSPHCPELPHLHNQELSAVLDGQQRLTALNIGLRGSMAIKQPNKWWNNPDAFPRRRLMLNLLAPKAVDEDGISFEFKFLSDSQVQRDDSHLWFPVADILGMQSGPPLFMWLAQQGLSTDELKTPFERLDRLWRVVHTDPLIYYYEEEDQDIERVLNIFIRLNSGGTALSYSDLLLSIAVAQWEKLDARAEIHRTVDELNRIGTGFNLTHDFVLKAGLMLADISSVGFKVENFTHENMVALEGRWPKIKTALVRTVELAASFGLNAQTLRADSSLLPIAYYLHARQAPENFVTHSQFSAERETIRQWLIRSLLKASGIWGSGLDTLLTALREVIRKDSKQFPEQALREVLDARGKSISFSEAEIEDLLNAQYGDKRVFGILSLIFSFVDLRNQFHVDHIFPISRFTPAKLKATGVPSEKHEELLKHANSLANLQLLEGPMNNEKRAKLPQEWLAARFHSEQERDFYRSNHLIGELDIDLDQIPSFCEKRRAVLKEKMKKLL